MTWVMTGNTACRRSRIEEPPPPSFTPLPRSNPLADNLQMKDLYKRLRVVGFDEDYVRRNLLPDWWDDSLATVPSNRAIAEASISRMLGFQIGDLRDENQELQLPSVATFKLKHKKNTKPSTIAPAVVVASQAVRAILRVLPPLPFGGLLSATTVRKEILLGRRFIDLEALIEFAWRIGVPVFHLSEVPKPSKKFAGLAIFSDGRPAIVLASGHDSPAWVCYQLAHELGHIVRGHVSAEAPLLVDGDYDGVDQPDHEDEADQFACEVLTGDPHPNMDAVYGMDGQRLARHANSVAEKSSIDPGVFALVYGKSAARMGVAQNALKVLGLDRGARTAISTAMLRHLPAELPESTERFVLLMTSGA